MVDGIPYLFAHTMNGIFSFKRASPSCRCLQKLNRNISFKGCHETFGCLSTLAMVKRSENKNPFASVAKKNIASVANANIRLIKVIEKKMKEKKGFEVSQ